VNDANCTATSCTLRQAVNASNATNPGASNANAITFDPATFTTTFQPITLSSAAGFGTLVLQQSVAITGTEVEKSFLVVDGGCTDCGAGNANTSGTGVRIFAVNGGVIASLSGLRITNGNAPTDANIVRGGGAILNNGGAVTVTDCVFVNNHAPSGGGAIANLSGMLTITGDTFSGNLSDFAGGAIFSNATAGAASMLTVTDSTFTGNQALAGGAIDNGDGSTATITASAFIANTGAAGSAILNTGVVSARLTLVNSTLSGNFIVPAGSSATLVGGTLTSAFANATTVVVGSTISGNTAEVNNSTAGVLTTRGGTVTLTDTISAGNTTYAGGSPDLFNDNGGTTAPFTGTNNLIGVGDGTNFTGLANGANGNQVGTAATPLDPQLAPLADISGPVQTRALLPGSPAIDTGTCAYTDATGMARTLTTDARGLNRPRGAACDVGSYEFLANPLTFIVTRTADDASNTLCNVAANGGCTLRQAINASDRTTGAGTNTITFDPAIFGAAQTITLSAAPGFGTLMLQQPVMITGPGAALLTVDGGCTDCGAGKANTSKSGVKVFAVRTAITVALSGLTIANGDPTSMAIDSGGAIDNLSGTVTVTNCAFTNNGGNAIGGAIANYFGTMTVTGSIFTSNQAGTAGAISNDGGSLSVTGSTFIGNQAGEGGAIYNDFDGTATITASTFTGNVATGLGGGAIFNSNRGILMVMGSTFTGNQAGLDGGAINNNVDGTATIIGSTFTGNTAPEDGSAIINITPIGGIARLTLVNSTLSGNISTLKNNVATFGGTLSSAFADATTVIVGSTISGNTATGNNSTGGVLVTGGNTVTLTDTIVAGNTVMGTGGSPDLFNDSRGATTAPFTGTNNVIGVGDGMNVTGLTNGANGNRVGTTAMPLNPLLAPLGLYAPGTTQTRALLPGSPAIDTGTCAYTDATGTAGTLATDARGVTRPQGGACDIGAFELRGGFTAGVSTGNGQSAAINTAFAAPVGLTVSSGADSGPVAGGQIIFTITPGAGDASAAFGAAGSCTLTSTTVAVCAIGTGGTTGTVASPPFTANGTAGSFTIVGTANGVSPTTTFTETNTTSVGTGTAPAAVADTATVTTGLSVSIPVLANDTLGTPAATLTAVSMPMHGTATISGASITYTPTGSFTGTDTFTYTISNSAGSSMATVTITVNATTTVTLTSLSVTAPAANGGTMPTLGIGGTMPLTTTGTYSNGATGSVAGLMYTSGTPTIAGVDPATGLVTAFLAGQTTVVVTAPNGTRTQITVTVLSAAGTGLMPPAPAPMAHAAAPIAGTTPVPQPATHPAGMSSGSGAQPQVAGAPTATPLPQPGRH